MPFEIIRNDITCVRADAIVNTTNPTPIIGYGVDSGIHQKAGPELLEARKKLGTIRIGSAAITPAFGLDARYVIHTVTPVWQDGRHHEELLLRSCYDRSLKLALQHDCQSIAFPLMAAGNHGFPKSLALQTAMNAISDFLLKHEMQVYLVVFSRSAFQLSEKLFAGVSSFIDENYVLQKNLEQYGVPDKCSVRGNQQQLVLEAQRRRMEAARESQRLYEEQSQHTVDFGRIDIPDKSCATEEVPADDMPCPPCPAPSADFADFADFAPSAGFAPSAAVRESAKAPQPPKAPKKSLFLPFLKQKLSLSDLLEQTDAGFSETLMKLIDQTGKKDSEIYTKANVSRQHFSKIRNNPAYKPTKATAIAFAVALELDLEQTEDLIGRAGYTLTMSSKFDVIIMYFINQRNYNMFDINAALFEFDQSLLGA